MAGKNTAPRKEHRHADDMSAEEFYASLAVLDEYEAILWDAMLRQNREPHLGIDLSQAPATEAARRRQ